jgi:glycosyltransferase involved in cell wall biosynthesis
VVVVPSRQEAFGQVASEALACGTPAVVSAGTGLEDIVVHGETGYVVPLRPHEILDAVAHLRRDEPIRSAMAASCSEAALRRFSPKTVGQAYSEVLNGVLSHG